jgi:hypothetical protein
MNTKKFLSGITGLILAMLAAAIFILSSDSVRSEVNEIMYYKKVSQTIGYMSAFMHYSPMIILCGVAGYLLGSKIYETILNKGTKSPEEHVVQRRRTRIRVIWGLLGSVTIPILALFMTQGLIFFAGPLLIFIGIFGYFVGAKLGLALFE